MGKPPDGQEVGQGSCEGAVALVEVVLSRVLVISDLQAPYHHPDALAFLLEVRDVYQTDEAICVGDELDLHAFSFYVSDPDLSSPGHELAAAKDALVPYFMAFPALRLCRSNHVDRLPNKAKKAGIPSCALRPIGEIIGAPSDWVWDHCWDIDGIRYEHGHELFGKWSIPKTALSRAPERNWCSTVFGHAHSVFGVNWIRTPAGRFFGMGVGCLVDETSRAFDYAGSKKTSQLGCGVVLDGVPHVVPMELDKRGRWVGRV